MYGYQKQTVAQEHKGDFKLLCCRVLFAPRKTKVGHLTFPRYLPAPSLPLLNYPNGFHDEIISKI
jgi:hypothetical protein